MQFLLELFPFLSTGLSLPPALNLLASSVTRHMTESQAATQEPPVQVQVSRLQSSAIPVVSQLWCCSLQPTQDCGGVLSTQGTRLQLNTNGV